MSIGIKITWDGETPGLREHRLSVAAFAGPLEKLLNALRRRAANIVRDATGREETLRGRIGGEAARIDIEIANLVSGSAGIDGQITLLPPPEGQLALFSDLAADAADSVLDDLEQEGAGTPRDKCVREYLESLPSGLTRQQYSLTVDGSMRREVVLERVVLAQLGPDLPFLVETDGKLIAVGFDPGRRWIKIKSNDGPEVSINARDETVDRALEWRAKGDISVLYLDLGNGTRKLVRIQPVDEAPPRLDTERFVFQKWKNVLEALAR